LVITRVRMLHFTKQYKDTLQMRLMILMSVCSKFITVYVYHKYSNKERYDKVIAKTKWCSFLCLTVYIRSQRFSRNRQRKKFN